MEVSLWIEGEDIRMLTDGLEKKDRDGGLIFE